MPEYYESLLWYMNLKPFGVPFVFKVLIEVKALGVQIA